MRKLKNGTIKYKKAALDKAAWMNQPPNPLPVFRRGQIIEVYRGSGWSKARVIESTPRGCHVDIPQANKQTIIYDARCLRPLKESKSDD